MKYNFGDTVILALGGSIINPGKINVPFLIEFKKFIEEHVKSGIKFVIVAGGGSVARNYQEALAHILDAPDEDKDYLGIHATRVNAHFLRSIFRGIADPTAHKRFNLKKIQYAVTVASGTKPGWSTDYVALHLAYNIGVKAAVIAGDLGHVYTKDIKIFKDAEPLEKLSWKEYRKLIPAKWVPGLHAPVDPEAAKFADKKNLAAIVINGTDLKNFANLLAGNDFEGTIIE